MSECDVSSRSKMTCMSELDHLGDRSICLSAMFL